MISLLPLLSVLTLSLHAPPPAPTRVPAPAVQSAPAVEEPAEEDVEGCG
jgi:hypothetical protein